MTRCETVSCVLKYQQTLRMISASHHSPTLTFERLNQTNSCTTLGFYFLHFSLVLIEILFKVI